jgi:hypothetical protein
MNHPGIYLLKEEEEDIIKDVVRRLEGIKGCPDWMSQTNMTKFELSYKFEKD